MCRGAGGGALSLDDLLPNGLGNPSAPDGGPILMGHPHSIRLFTKAKALEKAGGTVNEDGAAQWCMV